MLKIAFCLFLMTISFHSRPEDSSPYTLERNDQLMLFGLKDSKGKLILEVEHQLVEKESRELWPVVFHKDGKVLLINVLDNKKLSIIKYQSIIESDRQLQFPIPVKHEKKYGFLRENGKVDLIYDKIDQPNGIMDIYYFLVNGKWGLLSWDEKMLVKPEYDLISKNAYWPKTAIKNKKFDLISYEGKVMNIEPYDQIDLRYEGNVLRYKNKNTYGVLKPDGLVLIAAQFQDLNITTESLFLVKKNGLWGLVDSKSKFLIEPRFDALNGPFGKYYRARRDRSYYWTNQAGTIVTTLKFNPEEDDDSSIPPMPEPIDTNYDKIKSDKDVVLFLDEQQKPFHLTTDPNSLSLVLINRSKKSIVVEAADNIPLVHVEQLIDKQKWKILPEYDRLITCGKSYTGANSLPQNSQMILPVTKPKNRKNKVTLRFMVKVGKESIHSEPFTWEI